MFSVNEIWIYHVNILNWWTFLTRPCYLPWSFLGLAQGWGSAGDRWTGPGLCTQTPASTGSPSDFVEHDGHLVVCKTMTITHETYCTTYPKLSKRDKVFKPTTTGLLGHMGMTWYASNPIFNILVHSIYILYNPNNCSLII